MRSSRAMPVKDPLGDEVALAYSQTTVDQRKQVAEDWDQGERRKHVVFSDLLGIDPDGLLVASLLDAEHPSICNARGMPKASEYGKLHKMILAYTPPPVDNYPKTVDNSVESLDLPVDNSPKTVDNFDVWKACGQTIPILCTSYPHPQW